MNRSTIFLFAACLLVPGIAARAQDPSASAVAASASAPAAQAALTSIDIVFLDKDLRLPGLAVSNEPDPDLANWHVADIGRLLQERAPKVLAANGLTGTAIVVPAPAPGTAPDLGAIAPGRPLLVLRIDTIRKWAPRLFTKAGIVNLDVRLIEGAPDMDKPRWQAHLGGNQLGFDPVLGVLKTNRVDAEWIDSFLVFALDRLAKAGLVQLSGPKALSPKD